MKRDVILFVGDILEHIENIEDYTIGFSKGEFWDDKKTQDAVVRNIEIIGEAVKNIPEGFRKKYSEVEWQKIAGMRDILSHNYLGIDLELVWKSIKDELPKLKREIKFILKSENI
jgi:hypothetical protein